MAFWHVGGWFKKPHPVLVENRNYFKEFNQSRPLREYTFVVCDLELTGLNKRRDEIISIGAIKIIDLKIDLTSIFYEYVCPMNLSYNEATFVHHITPEQLRCACSIKEILPRFVKFCRDALIVGHFVGIDMAFLNRDAKRILGGTLSNPNIDTMRLARAYKESKLRSNYNYGVYHDHSVSYNLDDLSKEFGLPKFKSHDALEDAIQTAYLFLYLIKKLRGGNIKTLKQLYQAGRIWHLM